MICGADGRRDMQDLARAKAKWFATLRRVLSSLNPEAFERCFINWSQAVVDRSQSQLLAINGKNIRRSFDEGWDKC